MDNPVNFDQPIFIKHCSVVNYINVKCTNFSYKCCVLAAFSSYMYKEKQRSYKKFVRKMLMKLTPGHLWNRDSMAMESMRCNNTQTIYLLKDICTHGSDTPPGKISFPDFSFDQIQYIF